MNRSKQTTFGVGALAQYDSLQGLVPVKVTHIERRAADFGGMYAAEFIVSAVVTANVGAWEKGHTIRSSGSRIVPNSYVRRKRFSTVILGGYSWEVSP